MGRSGLFWLLSLLILAPFVADAAAPERVFVIHGVVAAPLADDTITIRHDAVPGYMPAMTMPFVVAAEAREEAARLKAGDEIQFQLRVGEDSRVDGFKRLRSAPNDASTSARALVERLRRLDVGDEVPDFALIDQDGRPLTAADLKGKTTVLTFIFTRCPVPDFCPRMSSRFQDVQRRTATDPGVQLLSVSFDPEFDTPAVLRAYGQRYGAEPGKWRLATGSKDQIATLRRLFAVHAEQSAAIFDHTLATAVIGPDLRVRRIWRGNQWKVDEVLAELGGGVGVGRRER